MWHKPETIAQEDVQTADELVDFIKKAGSNNHTMYVQLGTQEMMLKASIVRHELSDGSFAEELVLTFED